VAALPPAPDVLRRWLVLLQRPDLQVRFDEAGDLQADFSVQYQPETPLEITPRVFPVRLNNIRANARFSPKGIELWESRLDAGSAKDVRVSEALIEIRQPVEIYLDAAAEEMDLNEWLEGWEEQPWAAPPLSVVPGWQKTPDPVPFVKILGVLQAKRVKFLQFTAAA
jgi:hypothetical protein